MANPNEQLAAWQKAALESALTLAQTSIAGAEQLLKLNLDAARNALEQAGKNTRELLSITDPQELVELRSKIAQTNMQQSASYAQSIYEIVSHTQALLTKLGEEQLRASTSKPPPAPNNSPRARREPKWPPQRSSPRSLRPMP